MSVVIRLVEPAEHAAVADLLLDAYGSDYILSEDYRASLVEVAERAAEHEVWVAVDGAVVDGTAAPKPGPGVGQRGAREVTPGALLGTVVTPRPGRLISELAQPGEVDFRLLGVAPAARGRGVGEQLTRFVLDLARARGAERVVMNSGPQMTTAHRLYHRLGFERLPARETRVLDDGTRLFAFGYDLVPSHNTHLLTAKA
ncbi:Acetyltransferase (GNAT) family protein [Sanguibacter gelidistatuariae]|uniref:Acetyltransferase (GNAT) family protein n=1 Tax=Sanguibacter gelidistatuariae TaxID=1814289 RepID=A0A1G6HGU8_9MICO|nr:GNAT family N-acetyltransferase [Sanguibacter gelidistatuariae]SDB93155.1 Acetyltransferase (GNAT) family protein [Sanguibacter gelidistatuariae]